MAETKKVAILNRLRTIRGHVSGIEKMVEEERDCTDILIQMAAVTGSMKKVELVLHKHMAEQCVERVLVEGKDLKQEFAQLLDNILKFN